MNFLKTLFLSVAAGFLAIGGCGDSAPAGCASDLDCPSNAFCDIPTGACIVDGTVAIGAYCNDDRDCDPGDFCDGYTSECVAGDPALNGTIVLGDACLYDEECEPGDACDDHGFCVADTYSGEAVGAPCFEDADCSSLYCDADTDTCI
jgi:hypothetical protein